MPRSATVELELLCPACGRATPPPAGVVPFQWGLIPATYRTGDTLRWLEAPPLQLVERQGKLSWNCGDPSAEHVIIFDSEPIGEYGCASCGATFEAIAVEIERGRITRGLAFLPGECTRRFGRPAAEIESVEILPAGNMRVRAPSDEPLTPVR